MSLTNYITQSIIGITLFYGFGFNLYKSTGATACLFIAIIIFVVLLAASNLWLKKHRQGPLEWIWKKLTWIDFKNNKIWWVKRSIIVHKIIVKVVIWGKARLKRKVWVDQDVENGCSSRVICLIIKRQATAYFLQKMENYIQEDKFVDISTKRFIFSYFIFIFVCKLKSYLAEFWVRNIV